MCEGGAWTPGLAAEHEASGKAFLKLETSIPDGTASEPAAKAEDVKHLFLPVPVRERQVARSSVPLEDGGFGHSSWLPLFVVLGATACVAYADYLVRSISLGYLYVLPLCLSAVLLKRRITFVLLGISIFFHDLFGPPYSTVETRAFHNLTALAGFACVVLLLQYFVSQRDALFEVTRRQRDALMKDVELAAHVQRMFLPIAEPVIAGFNVSSMISPAKVVGGDYYDYIPRSNGTLELVIGDVAGRGVGAALLMAATAAVLQLEVRESRKLPDIISRLNRELHALTGDSGFVTLLLGELHPGSRRLRYVNCGHNPALLFRANTAEASWLAATCVPVGLFPTLHCEPEEVTLAAGDILVWYTDGLTEAENERGLEFGRERLLQAVRSNRGADARGLVDLIYDAVTEFTGRQSFDDDMTIVAIKAESD